MPLKPTLLIAFSVWSETVETARFLKLPLDGLDDLDGGSLFLSGVWRTASTTITGACAIYITSIKFEKNFS